MRDPFANSEINNEREGSFANIFIISNICTHSDILVINKSKSHIKFKIFNKITRDFKNKASVADVG